MTRFVQLHLLTAYPAANLNRDDTGRPKTLIYGGEERLRVSSQSLKRAFRKSDVFARLLDGALGTRSRTLGRILRDALVKLGKSGEDANKLTQIAIGKASGRAAESDATDKKAKANKLNILATWEKNEEVMFSQLINLGPDEIARLEAAADELSSKGSLPAKEAAVLLDKPRAADIAMFGRMLADNSGFNVEAAVQVAHAFTTHRVTVEDDYYTAVDDLKNEDRDQDRGAGFIGVQEYGAGLFYLYICIDADLLAANLSGDAALCADTIEALIRAATTVSPTGKQNAFASRAKAAYALVEIGEETPRTLASAFQHAVGARSGEDDQIGHSIARLRALRDGFARAYDERFDATVEMVVEDESSATLADLVGAARSVFQSAAAA